MELNCYYWSDGYFQIDTQIDVAALSDTPILDGYTDWFIPE